jgi:pantoate--beta-alanine ligase
MLIAMRTVTTIGALRAVADEARAKGGSVGLVPTMGYLHDGHLSLMAAAREQCELVVATIFVNPLQFAPDEDLDAYPRDPDGDAAKAAAAGVDVLFTPADAEMYPRAVLTTVSVAEISERMEGATRPAHFDGVTTVVAKLFAVIGPCRAYFGEKDYQQLALVTRMVEDLSFPVDVVGCPIGREPDGLALSSRNAYLNPQQRTAAPVLHTALQAGRAAVAAGERDPAAILDLVTDIVGAEPEADLDYVALADAATLRPTAALEPGRSYRLLAAARFGRPRLLDNLAITVPANARSGT